MTASTLLWLRRDLRLADHPAWHAALEKGGPVIPVFVLDPLVERWGAAPRWRLEQSLKALTADLDSRGSRLILRRGDAHDALAALADETGAGAIVWSRLYDAESIARDAEIKKRLRGRGLSADSVNGSLLMEPWQVETGQGSFYKVYTPFWRAVSPRPMDVPLPVPGNLAAPDTWPASDDFADWQLGRAMNRGAEVVARYAQIGEQAALDRLHTFLAGPVTRYKDQRDRLDRDATSRLSENLATGEISPRTIWRAAHGQKGAEAFLQEIVWREFAYHLLFHTPRLTGANWRDQWDDFPWRDDNDDAERWRQGRTGEPVVDAAMREMYVTGRMHNRARMLVASYLTKHLMTHWRVGEAWFRECLIDWDIASNAMGWQWAAGSGPDAAPFFRIFNPATQAEKFDPDEAYRKRWVAELSRRPGDDALAYFEAIPKPWGLRPDQPYPARLIDLKKGRERALAAYKELTAAA